MTEDSNAGLAVRLRATAHEMLQLAEELETKPRIRASPIPDQDMFSKTALVALAARWHSDRELRSRFFKKDLLGEPVWDMLLYLFVKCAEDRVVPTSALCSVSGVAPSTALRYVGVLCQAGLVTQRQCPSDGRVRFVAITQDGMVRMASYLAHCLRVHGSAVRRANLHLVPNCGQQSIPTAN